MGLAQRIKAESTVWESCAGLRLVDSLWNELLKEWADPDVSSSSDWDAAYCVGLAYAIAKIELPYVKADVRIERILERARDIVNGNANRDSSV
jgi:hypothetical protein